MAVKIDETVKEIDFLIDRYRNMAKNARKSGNDEMDSIYIGMIMAYEDIRDRLLMERVIRSIIEL